MIPLLITYNSFFPLCTNSFQNISNSHNNITNVPTKLYRSQMKRISGSHVCLLTNLSVLSLRECKLIFCLVLRRVNVVRIYSSITKHSKLDWSIQVTWKWRVLVNYVRLSIFAGIAARKLANASAVIFWSWSFIFRSRLLYYFESLFTATCGGFWTIHRKTILSQFLFNQPVSFYFVNKGSDTFLWILQNCQEHHFYKSL